MLVAYSASHRGADRNNPDPASQCPRSGARPIWGDSGARRPGTRCGDGGIHLRTLLLEHGRVQADPRRRGRAVAAARIPGAAGAARASGCVRRLRRDDCGGVGRDAVSSHTVDVTISDVRRHLGEYDRWIVHRPKFGHALEVRRSDEALVRQGMASSGASAPAPDANGRSILSSARSPRSPSDFRAFEASRRHASRWPSSAYGVRWRCIRAFRGARAGRRVRRPPPRTALQPRVRRMRVRTASRRIGSRVPADAEGEADAGSTYVRLGVL